MTPVPEEDWSRAIGAGSMESTVDDLAAWARALDRGKPFDFHAAPYPYGWGERRGLGRRRIEQTGLHDGFAAALALWPDDDLYVVTLSNLEAHGAWRELHLGLAALALGAEPEWPEREEPVALEPAQRERLLGRFRHPDGFELAVELAPDGLVLAGPWDEPLVLDELAPDRLRSRGFGTELAFAADAGSLRWIDGAGEKRCERVR